MGDEEGASIECTSTATAFRNAIQKICAKPRLPMFYLYLQSSLQFYSEDSNPFQTPNKSLDARFTNFMPLYAFILHGNSRTSAVHARTRANILHLAVSPQATSVKPVSNRAGWISTGIRVFPVCARNNPHSWLTLQVHFSASAMLLSHHATQTRYHNLTGFERGCISSKPVYGILITCA